MNLYQVNQALMDTIEAADPVSGEIDLLAFEKLQMEKTEKQANIAKYILHLGNDNDVLDHEIERLKKLKTINEHRTEWLTSYLRTSMEIDGVKELDFTTIKARIKTNPLKLVIDDEGKIPAKYYVKKVVESLAKDAIKLAISGGMEVAGCHVEQATRLEIK